MPVHRLNHAVLYVRDAQASAAFYGEALGFAPLPDMPSLPGAVFLRAPGSTNDHDLGLFSVGASAGPSAAGRGAVGLYHLAWEVDTLADLAEIADRLSRMGALHGATNHSTTKALYGRDPDGIEFEVSWLVPADLIDDEMLAARVQLAPLDIDSEIERFGADTHGGVGVSRVAVS
jgi:catechol-2,3-dioxygenase